MAKKYKTILSLLLVVLIAVSVVMVTGVLDINKMIKDKEHGNPDEIKTSYDDVFKSDVTAADRLMQTDIDGVFYTMTTNGEVKFYKTGEGKIENLPEKGTMDITVTCSGQKLPAKVHYVTVDGKTAGYGLFTNELHPEVMLYDYAFFKVTDMFPGFKSESNLMLLIDTDKNRFYSDDKIYSENFYLYSSGNTKYFLSENQRIVDRNARLRSDYKMFTDDILGQSGRVLFFSGRYYNELNKDNKLDILTSGGSGENIDNLRYIEDAASFNLWRTDKGTLYFANAAKGFELKLFDGDETTTTVKTFEGNIKEDYFIDGDIIMNKRSGEVYNIVKDENYKLDYTQFKMNFNPDIIDVSDNGNFLIVRGANNLKKPALGVMDFENNKFYTYKDDIFGYIASMHITDDGTMIISVANGESASSYSQLIGVAGKLLDGSSEQTTAAAEQ